MSERVAVAVPAYQAANSVGEVVERALKVAGGVLVVDDGSTDGTSDAAATAGAEVVRLDRNHGKGAALRRAFEVLFERDFDGVVTLDADGQHLPEEIPKLEEAFHKGADLVLGGRAHLFASMSRLRRLSNAASSRAISFAAGTPLRDVQTGFRAYRRELIATVGFPENRFEAESAVVVRAARRGFGVTTVPIDLGFADGRGTSHYRAVVDSVRIARAVWRARWEDTNG